MCSHSNSQWCLPGASLVPPGCLRDASAVPPVCILGASLVPSLVPPWCLRDASVVPPLWILGASLVPPLCLLCASLVPPASLVLSILLPVCCFVASLFRFPLLLLLPQIADSSAVASAASYCRLCCLSAASAASYCLLRFPLLLLWHPVTMIAPETPMATMTPIPFAASAASDCRFFCLFVASAVSYCRFCCLSVASAASYCRRTSGLIACSCPSGFPQRQSDDRGASQHTHALHLPTYGFCHPVGPFAWYGWAGEG